jgi:crotonobetainyl-CoA:carnitine CoA-transferase CaiB-like acyl-CoA transferase
MTQAPSTPSSAVDVHHARTTWLSHLRVASTSDSTALRMAGAILEQMGAHVISAGEDGQHSLSAAMTECDIVLVDRIEAAPHLPGLPPCGVAEYLDHVLARNQRVWVTASAFGLTDARAEAHASEVSLLAAGGILGHSLSAGPEWPPTIPAGSIALKLVGNVIAVAAMHGVHLHRESGGPIHVDVSAQGAVISTGLTLEMGHALAECPDEGGSARYGAPTGFFTCTDGVVYVLVLEDHQWSGFREALSPVLDDIVDLEHARARADEVNRAMAVWASARTTAECERDLQGIGVPCTTVNRVEDFVARAHAAGRPFAIDGPGTAALPALLDEVGPKVPSERTREVIALRDLRVLDAGHVLAVPLATAWLGAMGAQVTKAEDPERLDVYRRRGPFAHGVPGLNRSGYFNHINFCKSAIDIRVDRLGSSLDTQLFDVIVTNQSPHRASRMGVDASAVAAGPSPQLQLASSGFGLTGDLAGYRAYGTNIHAFAGLVAASRNARGEMASVGTPWADPLTSVALVAWSLAWSLAPMHTTTVTVDLSMAEVLAAQLADYVGVDPEREYLPAAEGGDFFIKLGRSGRLLAVSLTSPEDVSTFQRSVGSELPVLQRRGELVSLGGSVLDELEANEAEALLLEAGLKVSLVYTAHDLARDQRLQDVGLFLPVTSSTLGRYLVAGLPWQIQGGAPIRLWAAPERPGSERL